MKNLYIEAESFHGMCIISDAKSKNPTPSGYCRGLKHVEDVNTHKRYTIICKGSKNYAYLERDDGSLIW